MSQRPSTPPEVTPDDVERPALGPVCAMLRTKKMHVHGHLHSAAWRSSSTAQYWCLRTMQDFGPDDDFACPEDCQTSRRCHDAGSPPLASEQEV